MKSHGIHLGSNDYNRLNNNISNSSSYNTQLVNSFLNKSSPTRNNSSSLDIVGKVSTNIYLKYIYMYIYAYEAAMETMYYECIRVRAFCVMHSFFIIKRLGMQSK